jgi:hypothetical protein
MTYQEVDGQRANQTTKTLRKETKTMKLTSWQSCLIVLAVLGFVLQSVGSVTARAQSMNQLIPSVLNQLWTVEAQIKDIQTVIQQTRGLCAPDDPSCPIGPLTKQLQQVREKYARAAAAAMRNRFDEAINTMREARTLFLDAGATIPRLRLSDSLRFKLPSQWASIRIGTADLISEFELVSVHAALGEALEAIRQGSVGLCKPEDLTCPLNPLTQQLEQLWQSIAKAIAAIQQQQYRSAVAALMSGHTVIKNAVTQVNQLRLSEPLRVSLNLLFERIRIGFKGTGLQVRVTDLGFKLGDIERKLPQDIVCPPEVQWCPPNPPVPPVPPCPPSTAGLTCPLDIAKGFAQVKDKFEIAFTEIDLDRFASAAGPLRESQLLIEGVMDQVGKLQIGESLKSQVLKGLHEVQLGIQETLGQLGN